MKKTLLAVAVAAVLVTACGSSGDDDPAPSAGADGTPVTGANPMDVLEPGEGAGSGDGVATGSPAEGGPTDTTPSGPVTPVGEPGTDTAATAAAPLEEVSNALIVALAGYGADAKVAEVRALADAVATSAIASRELPATETSITGNGASILDEPTVAAPTATVLLDWSDFSLASGGTTRLEIDGSTRALYVAVPDLIEQTRSVALARYAEADAAGTVERLDDASLVLGTSQSFGYFGYGLTVSGTVATRVAGATVAVDTVTPFDRVYNASTVPGEDPNNVPFTGELTFRAEDGRTLTVSARDTGTSALTVDRRAVAGDGSVRESEGVPFAELSVYGPGIEPEFPR